MSIWSPPLQITESEARLLAEIERLRGLLREARQRTQNLLHRQHGDAIIMNPDEYLRATLSWLDDALAESGHESGQNGPSAADQPDAAIPCSSCGQPAAAHAVQNGGYVCPPNQPAAALECAHDGKCTFWETATMSGILCHVCGKNFDVHTYSAADNAAAQPSPRRALDELHQIDHETAQGLTADNAAAQPDAGRAYHETHEPPHCPTCHCGAEGNAWLEAIRKFAESQTYLRPEEAKVLYTRMRELILR